jgi:predicted Zn finger-like uncharacterized protein
MVSGPLTNSLLPSGRHVPPPLDSPMLITCTSCATSYEVAPSTLGPSGRSVRCVRCRHVWFAANTEALAEIAQAHRADVAALTDAPPAGGDPPLQPVTAADDPAMAPDLGDPAPDDGLDVPPLDAGSPPDAAPPSAPEPVTIDNAPPLAPEQPDAAEPVDIESVAARRAQRDARRRRWRQPGWSTAALALIAVNLALIGWRADIVRWLPQTASLYAAVGLPVNLRGLIFTEVTTTSETADGVPVLVVEGSIVNNGKRPAEVPRLRFSVRNQGGEEIYSWTALPTKNVLAAGEALPFRSRLASPPRETHQVVVRFFNRRDLAAGIQ